MAKYKYPAPFDVETPPLNILEIPNAPIPPSPPLLVNIPVDKSRTLRRDSLYKDLFGEDLSLIYMALHADWVSEDQRRLAQQVVDGTKDLHSMSTDELSLLDDLVHRYNDHGGVPPPPPPPPPKIEKEEEEPEPEPEGEEGEEEEEEAPEPSDEITGAYDW